MHTNLCRFFCLVICFNVSDEGERLNFDSAPFSIWMLRYYCPFDSSVHCQICVFIYKVYIHMCVYYYVYIYSIFWGIISTDHFMTFILSCISLIWWNFFNILLFEIAVTIKIIVDDYVFRKIINRIKYMCF